MPWAVADSDNPSWRAASTARAISPTRNGGKLDTWYAGMPRQGTPTQAADGQAGHLTPRHASPQHMSQGQPAAQGHPPGTPLQQIISQQPADHSPGQHLQLIIQQQSPYGQLTVPQSPMSQSPRSQGMRQEVLASPDQLSQHRVQKAPEVRPVMQYTPVPPSDAAQGAGPVTSGAPFAPAQLSSHRRSPPLPERGVPALQWGTVPTTSYPPQGSTLPSGPPSDNSSHGPVTRRLTTPRQESVAPSSAPPVGHTTMIRVAVPTEEPGSVLRTPVRVDSAPDTGSTIGSPHDLRSEDAALRRQLNQAEAEKEGLQRDNERLRRVLERMQPPEDGREKDELRDMLRDMQKKHSSLEAQLEKVGRLALLEDQVKEGRRTIAGLEEALEEANEATRHWMQESQSQQDSDQANGRRNERRRKRVLERATQGLRANNRVLFMRPFFDKLRNHAQSRLGHKNSRSLERAAQRLQLAQEQVLELEKAQVKATRELDELREEQKAREKAAKRMQMTGLAALLNRTCGVIAGQAFHKWRVYATSAPHERRLSRLKLRASRAMGGSAPLVLGRAYFAKWLSWVLQQRNGGQQDKIQDLSQRLQSMSEELVTSQNKRRPSRHVADLYKRTCERLAGTRFRTWRDQALRNLRQRAAVSRHPTSAVLSDLLRRTNERLALGAFNSLKLNALEGRMDQRDADNEELTQLVHEAEVKLLQLQGEAQQTLAETGQPLRTPVTKQQVTTLYSHTCSRIASRFYNKLRAYAALRRAVEMERLVSLGRRNAVYGLGSAALRRLLLSAYRKWEMYAKMQGYLREFHAAHKAAVDDLNQEKVLRQQAELKALALEKALGQRKPNLGALSDMLTRTEAAALRDRFRKWRALVGEGKAARKQGPSRAMMQDLFARTERQLLRRRYDKWQLCAVQRRKHKEESLGKERLKDEISELLRKRNDIEKYIEDELAKRANIKAYDVKRSLGYLQDTVRNSILSRYYAKLRAYAATARLRAAEAEMRRQFYYKFGGKAAGNLASKNTAVLCKVYYAKLAKYTREKKRRARANAVADCLALTTDRTRLRRAFHEWQQSASNLTSRKKARRDHVAALLGSLTSRGMATLAFNKWRRWVVEGTMLHNQTIKMRRILFHVLLRRTMRGMVSSFYTKWAAFVAHRNNLRKKSLHLLHSTETATSLRCYSALQANVLKKKRRRKQVDTAKALYFLSTQGLMQRTYRMLMMHRFVQQAKGQRGTNAHKTAATLLSMTERGIRRYAWAQLMQAVAQKRQRRESARNVARGLISLTERGVRQNAWDRLMLAVQLRQQRSAAAQRAARGLLSATEGGMRRNAWHALMQMVLDKRQRHDNAERIARELMSATDRGARRNAYDSLARYARHKQQRSANAERIARGLLSATERGVCRNAYDALLRHAQAKGQRRANAERVARGLLSTTERGTRRNAYDNLVRYGRYKQQRSANAERIARGLLSATERGVRRNAWDKLLSLVQDKRQRRARANNTARQLLSLTERGVRKNAWDALERSVWAKRQRTGKARRVAEELAALTSRGLMRRAYATLQRYATYKRYRRSRRELAEALLGTSEERAANLARMKAYKALQEYAAQQKQLRAQEALLQKKLAILEDGDARRCVSRSFRALSLWLCYSRLHSSCEAFEEEQGKAHSGVLRMSRKSGDYLREVESLRKELQALTATVQDLRGRNTTLQQKNAQLEGKMSKINTPVPTPPPSSALGASYTLRIQDSEPDFAKTQEAAEQESAALRRQLETTKAKNDTLTNKLDAEETRCTELANECSRIAQELRDLRAQEAAAQEENDQLKEQNDRLANEIDSGKLHPSPESSVSAPDKRAAEAATLREEASEALRAVDQAEREKKALRAQLDTSEQSEAALREDLRDAERQNAMLQDRAKELQGKSSQLREAEREAAALQSRIEDLQATVDELQPAARENAVLQAKNNDLQERMADLRGSDRDTAALEAQVQELQGKAAELRQADRHIAALQAKVDSLERSRESDPKDDKKEPSDMVDEDVQRYLDTIFELETENSRLRTELFNLNRRWEDASHEDLHGEASRAQQRALATLQEENNALQEELRSLRLEAAGLRRQAADAKQGRVDDDPVAPPSQGGTQMIRELAEENVVLRRQAEGLGPLRDQCAELAGEVEVLKEENARLEEEVHMLRNDTLPLQAEGEATPAGQQLREARADQLRMESKMRIQEREATSQADTIKQLQEANAALAEELAVMNGARDSDDAYVPGELQRLREANEQLQDELDAQRKSHRSHDGSGEAGRQYAQVSVLPSQYGEYSQLTLAEQLDGPQQGWHDAPATLQQQLEEAKQENASLISMLEEARQDHTARLGEAQQDYDTVAMELQKASAENTSILSRAGDAQRRADALSDQVEELHQENDTLREHLTRRGQVGGEGDDALIADLTHQLKEKDELIDRLRREIEELRRLLGEKAAQLDSMRPMMMRMREEASELEANLTDHRRTAQDTETELARAHDALQKKDMHAKKLQGEKQTLEGRVRALENDFLELQAMTRRKSQPRKSPPRSNSRGSPNRGGRSPYLTATTSRGHETHRAPHTSSPKRSRSNRGSPPKGARGSTTSPTSTHRTLLAGHEAYEDDVNIGLDVADAVHIGGQLKGSIPYGVVRVVSAQHPAAPTVREGDLILSLNGQPTPTIAQFRKALSACHPGKNVRLHVRRRVGGSVKETELDIIPLPRDDGQRRGCGVNRVVLKDKAGLARGLEAEPEAVQTYSPRGRRGDSPGRRLLPLKINPLAVFKKGRHAQTPEPAGSVSPTHSFRRRSSSASTSPVSTPSRSLFPARPPHSHSVSPVHGPAVPNVYT